MSSTLIYITGLSGSGKTTLGLELQKQIPNSIFLDGDIIRNTLNKDLGFDRESKIINIQRNNELIKILYDQGFTIISAFMASISTERDKVFTHCKCNYKIQLNTPMHVCIQRDVKGLYLQKPENFSGVNFPYNGFEVPHLTLDTSLLSPSSCIREILNLIDDKSKITKENNVTIKS